ncbi:ATP-binding protein [Desulfovibrio psychrotolerans]|uniref:histidine kinase n=1 Tax=Desulfovibrio psychrotolerans TaxID=415242 RepID=A0A7J0BW50_9BACT|nr:ATP-binding protein [Desulfovibrio psychrotolerans]GFM37937.1 histidine kinase [Desulfovibrio psychrotolerans]
MLPLKYLRLSRMRFRNKLNLGITLIVVLSSIVLATAVTRISADALLQESKRRGQVLADNLALRAADPMLSVDLLVLKNMVDELHSVDEDILYAFFLDDKHRILVHSFAGGFPSDLRAANLVPYGESKSVRLLDTGRERIYDFAVPVVVAGRSVGTARIGLSHTKAQEVVQGLIVTIAGLAGIALLVAIFISTQFARRISLRLGQLREHAEEMVRGNLELDTGVHLHRNCWEIQQCQGRDCPAYGDTERRCWYLAGTMCANCNPEDYPGKMSNCRECPVFLENAGDEIQELSETFDVMALSLRKHITDLQRAQKDITRQQELLRTILSVSPDQVSLIDRNFRYLAVNRAFARFFGNEEHEIIGLAETDVISPLTDPERQAETRAILRDGTPVNREALIVSAAGVRRWFHILRVPVLDERQRIIGVLTTARDITDLKSYQDQLIHSQKMESVGKLAGGVAHEVNTPLGIILGYAQLLQEDVPPESQIHQDLAIIEKQAKFCRKIVADLLGFSRQTSSEKKEMCFNNSVMEVVQLIRHAFKLDHLEIITDLDDRFPVIYGDPEKLKQVWINLLSNAAEATECGGIIKIVTRLDVANFTITAIFMDTGSGIREEDRKAIFDPFFSTKPVGKGTGLGLSVSFGIIEDHEGTIEAVSPLPQGMIDEETLAGITHGPGTAFIVTLPLESSDGYEPRTCKDKNRPAEAASDTE